MPDDDDRLPPKVKMAESHLSAGVELALLKVHVETDAWIDSMGRMHPKAAPNNDPTGLEPSPLTDAAEQALRSDLLEAGRELIGMVGADLRVARVELRPANSLEVAFVVVLGAVELVNRISAAVEGLERVGSLASRLVRGVLGVHDVPSREASSVLEVRHVIPPIAQGEDSPTSEDPSSTSAPLGTREDPLWMRPWSLTSAAGAATGSSERRSPPDSADGSQDRAPGDQQSWAVWRDHLERQAFEHELIDRKAKWLLASQTLLFAAYGLTFQGNSADSELARFRDAVPVLGMAIAALVLLSVLALINSKRMSWLQYRDFYRAGSFSTPNPWPTQDLQWGVKTSNTWLALAADVSLPAAFAATWAYLIS